MKFSIMILVIFTCLMGVINVNAQIPIQHSSSSTGGQNNGIMQNTGNNGHAYGCWYGYTQEGYNVTGCGNYTTYETYCSATCYNGDGTVTGTVQCVWNGYIGETLPNGMGNADMYSGSFSGCNTTVCGAYTQSGYTISGCDTSVVANGTLCSATCAPGYLQGTPIDVYSLDLQFTYPNLFCDAYGNSTVGVWGYNGMEYQGCFAIVPGCNLTPAMGYEMICFDAQTDCTPTCASGYSGTPIVSLDGYSAAMTCDGGSLLWADPTPFVFNGCMPTVGCAPYTQTGYIIDNFQSYTSSGVTSASAICATGYTGTPSGSVTCSGSTWSGSYTGCV